MEIYSIFFFNLTQQTRNALFCGYREAVTTHPGDVAVTGEESCLNIRTPSGVTSLALPAGVAFEQGSCIPTPAGESCEELHFRLRITLSKSMDPGKINPGYRWKVRPDFCILPQLYVCPPPEPRRGRLLILSLFKACCLFWINWTESLGHLRQRMCKLCSWELQRPTNNRSVMRTLHFCHELTYSCCGEVFLMDVNSIPISFATQHFLLLIQVYWYSWVICVFVFGNRGLWQCKGDTSG